MHLPTTHDAAMRVAVGVLQFSNATQKKWATRVACNYPQGTDALDTMKNLYWLGGVWHSQTSMPASGGVESPCRRPTHRKAVCVPYTSTATAQHSVRFLRDPWVVLAESGCSGEAAAPSMGG